MKYKSMIAAIGIIAIIAGHASAQRYMEKLNRGLIAVKSGSGYFLSWRLFGTDPQDNTFGFNVYKGATKLNTALITNATCYQDNTGGSGAYTVKPVTGGLEGAASEAALALDTNYLSIPLIAPDNILTPNDCSVGDLDGDHEYEIVLKWESSNTGSESYPLTSITYLDGYKLNGSRLWRIALGNNIRGGPHFTQFMVYDLDGDGCAEVACKTAPGTRDGLGNFLKLGPAAADNDDSAYHNSSGYILSGPEYYTIFSGKTGAELATIDYKPPRGNVCDWGDCYGNRVDRFLACVAYLDGQRPSVVACRGYYARTTLWALDFRDGKLAQRWFFDSDIGGDSAYAGQGCHSIRAGDVDGDGFDEIIYGACAIDHDGKGLYSTGLGHGDALHLSDMDPDRPGLEVWQVHENAAVNGNVAASFRDAKTGAIIWSSAGISDNGRGMAAPLLAGVKSWQMWSGLPDGLFDATGTNVGNKPLSDNFAIWWDGDLLRELLNSTTINKYGGDTLLKALGCASNNGTKATPCLTADLFGDWREEVIWRTSNNSALRIYTTTAPTTNRLYTLMHDPVYRLSVASENVAYNQPPEPGSYIGYGMTLPQARPDIRYYDESVGNTEQSKTFCGPISIHHSIKVFGNRNFALPIQLSGMQKLVTVYDCSGKLVRKAIVKNNEINLQRDFDMSNRLYVVRVVKNNDTER
jgi:rhamnogalacturonan endolyase